MEQIFVIKDLTKSDIETILNGLAELQAKVSYNLIAKVATQYKAQDGSQTKVSDISGEGEVV